MKLTRRATARGLGVLPFVATAPAVRAQAPFPSKPCTIVVPFPAGGPADIFGRHLAERMAPLLGQPMLVDNKSGAAGVTGVDYVVKSGDPHVMGLVSASAGAIMPSLMPRMPYDPVKDIAPQVLVVRVQEVFAVSSKLGIVDLRTFLERARAKPGKLTCGSAGTGGITHLAIELFKRETGTDLLHVPYRGAAPATNDLLAGTVDTALLDLSVLVPHVRSGAVKVLAVTSDVRSTLVPDAPTMREMGYPRVNSDNWYALLSPASAPAEARRRIHDAATQALTSKELAEAFAAVGGVVGGGTSEQVRAFIAEETQRWAAIIKSANVKLE